MQSASRVALPKERVRYCCRQARPHSAAVNVYHSPKNDSYHYGNLMVCGSVWVCPVCGSKITEKRRAELVQAVTSWKDQGRGVLLLTLTIPHYAHQSVGHVLDGITDARRRLLNRKPWKRLKEALGVVGDIRALEVTYGANGWHPHFHVLVFTRLSFTSESLLPIKNAILAQWQSACVASGLPEPNHHGVSVEDGSKAASYASKWGIESEMTKGHMKKSRDGYHPFDFLRVMVGSYQGDGIPLDAAKASRLFREYASAFKGKRQLVWSDGLRELLQLGQEASDEDLAKLQEEDAHLFAEIPLNVWRLILRRELRGELLEVCRQGFEPLLDWMTDICEDAGMIGDA